MGVTGGRNVFVSIVIPVHNAEAYLRDAIDALVAQDYPSTHYEILIVDNRSTDRSVEIARRYPQVTMLTEPVAGSYAARNRGIAAARGDVIAFIDADCVPDVSWVRAIAEAMSEAGVDLVCGRRLSGGRSALLQLLMEYESTKDAFVLGCGVPELYYGYTCNMAVRRKVFDEVGRFRELSRGADTLFVRQLTERASSARIRYLATAAVRHLEVDRLVVYYRKVFLYGRHRRLNNGILRSRPLNTAQRFRIFRRTVTAGRVSLGRSMALFAALAVGARVWHAGAASARGGRR